MKIQFIKINDNTNAALVVNHLIVTVVNTDYSEDGTIKNLEMSAQRLQEATGFPLEIITKEMPDEQNWNWADLVNEMNAGIAAAAINSELIPVPREMLSTIIELANSHLADIDSGLEDGTYDEDDNADHEKNTQTVNAAESLLSPTLRLTEQQYHPAMS